MTKYSEVTRIGPVIVNKIEAEVLNTPTKYAYDCTACGVGSIGLESQIVAEREAANHRDEEHGRTDDANTDV